MDQLRYIIRFLILECLVNGIDLCPVLFHRREKTNARNYLRRQWLAPEGKRPASTARIREAYKLARDAISRRERFSSRNCEPRW
jgi:hypothetical protein